MTHVERNDPVLFSLNILFVSVLCTFCSFMCSLESTCQILQNSAIFVGSCIDLKLDFRKEEELSFQIHIVLSINWHSSPLIFLLRIFNVYLKKYVYLLKSYSDIT